MSLYLSKRHDWVLQSEIRNMSIECDRVRGINLSQGVCDTEVPAIIRTGAKRAIDDGINCYTRYDGIEELRQAIAQKQKRYSKMDVDSESEIVVSAGATGAFYCACLALLNPRDEVILFEPYYGYHISTLVAVGAVPKYVRLDIPGWTFTYDQLEKVYTSKTRGIMLNTPANPSGKVFSKAELTMISDFAIKHDLFVFTDEIYEHFVYDGREHISPATLPGMRERTITISGFSKTYSITGWRIGYAICDKKWAQTIGFFNDLVYVCAPAPLQLGVAKGLFLLGSDFYNHISGEFLTKRNLICSTLANIGLTPNIPQGAYYILADISCLPGKTSKERAMYLLYATGVASVPGEAFYHDGAGENLARFCFAKDDETIKKACHKLRQL